VADALIRKQLAPGVIDLCVGEAHVVRTALLHAYDERSYNVAPGLRGCDYQQPNGYAPLVELLEKRYGKRVVITCGAKQGLSACFYAMQMRGCQGVSQRAPYWSQMPAAIRLAGLTAFSSSVRPAYLCAYLLVSPNNPDGWCASLDEVKQLEEECRYYNVPLVHDAAYHTPVYVDADLPLSLALTSVHSVSKAYGLSGLRVGWVVTDDDFTYDRVCEYCETTTVGVSLPAQVMTYQLLEAEQASLVRWARFVREARKSLAYAKHLMTEVNQEVLVTAGCESVPGMFGWYAMGPKFDAEKARIHVAPGSAFGDSLRVRLNLAVDPEVLQEAVRRLNQL
jgi:aspartate/methionine/tyrosine aminotransferase